VAYDLQNRLVIGIASSALFDLQESEAVFNRDGEDAYREYQEAHLDSPLQPGIAFPFIRRLLALNNLRPTNDPLVEVIILSRNDPDTGLRVMRSVQAHDLSISRAIFMQGRSPYKFMPALNMSLFLSAHEPDVLEAVNQGLPAGRVLQSSFTDDPEDGSLRIAFDFDGVLANDTSESIYQSGGLDGFQAHEVANASIPHGPGPLKDLLAKINVIQQREQERLNEDPGYRMRVHVALLTARNAPAHERAVLSLKQWGVRVNDAFFLGGIEKAAITAVLKPHIFFDDQKDHLEGTSKVTPSVHVPFGRLNRSNTASADATSPAAVVHTADGSNPGRVHDPS
jgi:5'-nucleotidase